MKNSAFSSAVHGEPISSHAEHTGNRSHRMLSLRGNVYKSNISAEYDFQKSRVTGPWDHKVSVSAKKVKKKFHACVPLNVFKLD
jgi:hypothetical protein